MKFSEKWLREWVNPEIDTGALAHQLTMAGLEVDAIEPVAGQFDHVVVGEVIKLEPHPDADKLRVATVNVGADEPLQIVCGAANVREGLKAPTALVGAKLPGDLKIKKSKLRGVPSQGMLCSEKELGLADSAEGLMELPNEAPVGASLRDYLQLDDVTIELGLTPNRGDCLSVAGIAREVGVLNKLSIQGPDMGRRDAQILDVQIKDTLSVALEAPGACPQYAGRVLRGIDPTARTPLWLAERLRRSGLRSLGPVVDVTNYVLLELGQPMHAFDLGKLHGGIHVRYANAGESLTLLDEQMIELDDETLVIADDETPVALAGIMGGADSAVGEGTVDIFLESAYFAPQAIAGKARGYGLHTDSSHRFERGVDPQLQVSALERATALLQAICGGEAGPVVHVQQADQLPVRTPVRLRRVRIARVLGADIPVDSVEDILQRLGMKVRNPDRDEGRGTRDEENRVWEVTPPSFRFDINLEVDLIEELGRIYGYDNLPASRPRITLAMGARPETRLKPADYKRLLVDLGYQEAVTYSFVDPKLQQQLDPQGTALMLANPISAEMAAMRTSLWPGLLQTALYNLNRQQDRVLLFEQGLKFIIQDTELKQEPVLAGLLTGSLLPPQWGSPARQADFFDCKGHVEQLLARTGHGEQFRFEPDDSHPALHPGQAAVIRHSDRVVGRLGALHPALQQQLGLSQRVYLFEIDQGILTERRLPAFVSLSKYPSIRRDIAIVVDENIGAQKVKDCIEKAASGWLRNIELFDVYVGEGIDSGRKSLALGLTLQDLSRTLKDKDVESELSSILTALDRELGATLRE
ncbi:phenylalanine--tRNA ligase subunit beta [Thiohalophilus sp.]|uniref:phenylalanine--tRNA ligase subunit beta n=1 Tax=Thiohalophilus sp. TaxID=3028392 RepID=UPI002ACD8E12|nr:phenylalanine--tRNA ligase subunit beta [Thiohalophilus sp.]MDZ7804435.1 phenylalanine--tRNA ligase subunit beta [Thiohalophilus sp.]